MGADGCQFVFVGSADGHLRAFRQNGEDTSLSPAGTHKCENLSFFALGQQTEDGNLWVFVSGKFRLEALVYSQTKETFTAVSSVATSGSGTHLTIAAQGRDELSLFLAHYHEHCVSSFRYCQRSGWSDERLVEPGRHPHQTKVQGSFVYVSCLGSNCVAQYRRIEDKESGAPLLVPLESASTPVPGGPRHMALSPDGQKALVLCELESRLETLEIGSDGRLKRREDLAVFAHPDGGSHWSSDVVVSPDGAFAYAINRDPPEIVTFSLAKERPERLEFRLPLSAPVRSFSVSADGSCLFVGGEDGVLWTVLLRGEVRRERALDSLGPIRHTAVVRLQGASGEL